MSIYEQYCKEIVDENGRLKKITLTQKALEVQCVVNDAFDRFESTMKKGISEAELETFFTVLQKINSNMERNDGINDKTTE